MRSDNRDNLLKIGKYGCTVYSYAIHYNGELITQDLEDTVMSLNAQTHNASNNALVAAAESHAGDHAPEASNAANVQSLPIASIHKRENHNPRRIRSKKERQDLKASIAEKGVLQSILVRPHPEMTGDYELVAGETRFDLAQEVGLTEIPAVVRDLDDSELLDFATTENTKRANMSPIDEGRAAQAMMITGKTRDEVCRLMGWKPAFLDGRIQLTHCSDTVAQALCDEEITMGHAQLLSSLRPESQESALKIVLDRNMTVDILRQTIDSMSLKLAAACFDTTDCQTCPHNSSTQATLFADSKSMAKARCLNKTCFDSKTTAHLDALKAELAESCHKVAFTSEVPAGTTAIIVSTGAHGVGEEQASACEGCEHFGATINDTLGAKADTQRSVCFNLSCHSQKVKAYRTVIATDAKPAANPSTNNGSTQATGEAAGAADKTDAKAGTSATPKAASKAKPAVAKSAIPAKIVDQHHQIHRKAAAVAVNEDDKAALIISVLCMMSEAGVKPDNTPKGWPPMLTGTNRAQAAKLLDTLSIEQLTKLQRLLAAKLLESAKRGDGENEKDGYGALALWVANTRKVDLTKHFTMNADYLEAFTKPMVAQRLKEAGFDAHYEKAHGEKAFAKLANGKKGDLIQAIKDSDFDFAGYLPEGLKLAHSTTKAEAAASE